MNNLKIIKHSAPDNFIIQCPVSPFSFIDKHVKKTFPFKIHINTSIKGKQSNNNSVSGISCTPNPSAFDTHSLLEIVIRDQEVEKNISAGHFASVHYSLCSASNVLCGNSILLISPNNVFSCVDKN